MGTLNDSPIKLYKEKITTNNLESHDGLGQKNLKDFVGYENVILSICETILFIEYQKLKDTFGFLVHGPIGVGKSYLINLLAKEFSWPIIKFDASDISSGISGASEKKIKKFFDAAKSLATSNSCHSSIKATLQIENIDLITSSKDVKENNNSKNVLAQLISSIDDLINNPSYGVLIIATTTNIDSIDPSIRRAGRLDKDFALGMPNESSRYALFEYMAKNYNLDSDDVCLRTLVRHTPGFVAADIKALLREAHIKSLLRKFREETPIINNSTSNPNTVGLKIQIETLTNQIKSGVYSPSLNNTSIKMDDFEQALKSIIPTCKKEGFYTAAEDTMSPIDFNGNLEDLTSWDFGIGAMQDLKREITLCLRGAVRYPELYNLYGLENPATGILLVGPPGCGKTLLARAVARESALNFIAIKGPELLNMYVGETERAIRQCFSRARDSAPCLVFFDEIDSLCPRRGGTATSNKDNINNNRNETSSLENSASRIVNQLLTEMDGIDARKRVFVMGATNRLDVIDKAILRPGRFDKIFHVALPNAEERLDILRVLTRSCNFTSHATRKQYNLPLSKLKISNDDGCLTNGFTKDQIYGITNKNGYKNNKNPKNICDNSNDYNDKLWESLYADDVDLKALAYDKRCHNFSGADLAALVKEASRQALSHHLDSYQAMNKESFVAKRLKSNDANGINGDYHNTISQDLNHIRPKIHMYHFQNALNVVKASNH